MINLLTTAPGVTWLPIWLAAAAWLIKYLHPWVPNQLTGKNTSCDILSQYPITPLLKQWSFYINIIVYTLKRATHLVTCSSPQSAKIVRCGRWSDCNFRRSPRSAHKITNLWHVRYWRLNLLAFTKCAHSRDFLQP